MALSLGVRIGSKIAVGDHEVQVKILVQPSLIVVSVDGGRDIVVSDQEQIEILLDVAVFSGVGAKGTGGGNRLAFVAPREILIRRLQ
jgi:hypothetical protein